MRYQSSGKMMVLIFLLALFSVLGAQQAKDQARKFTQQKKTTEDPWFRQEFFSEQMRAQREVLSPSCKHFLEQVEKEITYYPVPESSVDPSLTVSYENGWMAERKYKDTHAHEGTDLMAARQESGIYPVISITNGTVTNIGWLERGGYRVGITSDSGTYYYYAHLESYANLKKGDSIRAGQLLGYMGDSGYGPEGTTGQFAVHLHLGIYSYENGKENSVNPYYVLRFLENKKLKYAYS